MFERVVDRLLRPLAPHQCLGCGRDGALLCDQCKQLVPDVPLVCYRCGKSARRGVTCAGCRKSAPLTQVQVVTVYEGVVERLVWQYKFERVYAALDVLASLMSPVVESDMLLVPAPTISNHVRLRGYDHTLLLVRAISRSAGVPYAALLSRTDQESQVGKTRAQRQMAVRGKIVPVMRIPRKTLKDKRIVLVDDVFTTGSTLEESARVLRAAGARRVEALVFARPE